ncbi:regulator, partial [Mycobacterium tuberculosis]
IYISGQLPIDPTTGKLVSDDMRMQTEQVLRNIEALLTEAGLNMSYVLKTTVYVKNMEDFAGMNEVYTRFFQKPFPARSAVAVKD